MTLPRVLVGVLTVAILLTGCAPTVTASTPTPSATPEPTASPTPEVPVPTSVLLSLDALTVLDADGGTLESAPFTDPDAVLALLTGVFGSTPVPIDNHKFGILYEWPGVKFVVNYGTGKITVASTDVGGLALNTSQGIHVGSTRDEVAALSPFDANYDVDGDGVSDRFGLDPREVPDSESLAFPGQVGTAFIEVLLQGDVVVSLQSPASDFFDV